MSKIQCKKKKSLILKFKINFAAGFLQGYFHQIFLSNQYMQQNNKMFEYICIYFAEIGEPN